MQDIKIFEYYENTGNEPDLIELLIKWINSKD